MKHAKVAEVLDVPSAPNPAAVPKSLLVRERIEGLLIRYPDVSEAETQEILIYLKKGPHLDVGILAAKEGIEEKVEALRKTKKEFFRLGYIETALFLTFTAGPAVLGFWYFLR
jgi:hypothetical protein